jgi:hypothetical protein
VNSHPEGRERGLPEMELRKTDTDVLQKAVEAFRRATGIRVRLQPLKPRRGWPRADARLRFEFPRARKRFDAEVKRRLAPLTLGQAIDQMKRLPEKALFITQYVRASKTDRPSL